jgi:hypothetical protein
MQTRDPVVQMTQLGSVFGQPNPTAATDPVRSYLQEVGAIAGFRSTDGEPLDLASKALQLVPSHEAQAPLADIREDLRACVIN